MYHMWDMRHMRGVFRWIRRFCRNQLFRQGYLDLIKVLQSLFQELL